MRPPPLSALRLPRLAPPHPCAFPTRSLTSSSAQQAPYQYTTLPERALLAIGNKDAPKFLQGLVTNDVRRMEGVEGERALYAGMLKADGRYLYDIFLLPSSHPADPTLPSLLIDHPSSSSPALRTYLKRHILRTKVFLAREADPTLGVFAAWRTDEPATEEEVREAEDWLREKVGAGEDRRAPGMGWRWAGAISGEAIELPPPDLIKPSSPAHHHLHRLTLSVPEGPKDFAQLPLEANLDLMGAVDYKKGCYVGQELTARTKHKGVVRKRGVAFRLFREGEDVPTQLLPTPGPLTPYPGLFPLPPPLSTLTPLQSSSPRARPSGKLGSSLPLVSRAGSSSALAFGSVRLEHLTQGDGVFVVKAPKVEEGEMGELEGEAGMGLRGEEEEGGRWLAKAFMSEWVERRLREDEEAKRNE